MRVCVCACVRVCVRACVRACVRPGCCVAILFSSACSGNESKLMSLTARLRQEEGRPEAADCGRGTSVPGAWRAVWPAVCR